MSQHTATVTLPIGLTIGAVTFRDACVSAPTFGEVAQAAAMAQQGLNRAEVIARIAICTEFEGLERKATYEEIEDLAAEDGEALLAAMGDAMGKRAAAARPCSNYTEQILSSGNGA